MRERLIVVLSVSKMKQYIIIFFIAAVNTATSEDPEPEFQYRVVGGFDAAIQKYPYHVSLISSQDKYVCGGSILDANHVLTACHCVSSVLRGYVRSGTNFREKGGTLHKIVRGRCHQNFNRGYSGLSSDIAILTVRKPFAFDSTRAPVKIDFRNFSIAAAEGKMSVLTGFGSKREGDRESSRLSAVKLPIISREICSELYEIRGFEPILEDRLCAGPLNGGKDACQGDSGGPLVIDGHQIGIVSYGFGCARPNFPGIYVNLANYEKWIKKTIEMDNKGFLKKFLDNFMKVKKL